MTNPEQTEKVTVGDLTAHGIGRDRVIIQHEGSTVSGVLTALVIESETVTNRGMSGKAKSVVVDVRVTVTVGSITVGPLRRDHACEALR